MASIHPEMFSAGTFMPMQFATIQGVFKDIAAEPWFTRSPEKQQQFALYVIGAYRQGMIESDTLRSFCFEGARQRFCDGGANED